MPEELRWCAYSSRNEGGGVFQPPWRMGESKSLGARRIRSFSAALVAVVLLGLGGPAQATPLTVTWFDVDDTLDAALGPDLLAITLTFDTVTGDYTIRLTASTARPFAGNFRVNLNTFNVDDSSGFFDNVNDFVGVAPTTSFEFSDSSPLLLGWEAGDRVADCANASRCNTALAVPGAFASGTLTDQLVSQQGFSIIAVVPEPTTAALLWAGLLGFGLSRRRWTSSLLETAQING